MTSVREQQKSIRVDVPVRTAYDQWTQFEEFPRFMEGVERVEQLDDSHMHWRAKIGGQSVEWDARVVDQEPDSRISWRSEDGVYNAGTVSFTPDGPGRTQVTLRMEFEPEGVLQKTGDALGFVSKRVEGDLKRFKEFIEKRGQPTGSWRGRIRDGIVEDGDDTTSLR